MNLFLIGYRCSGKTAIGQAVAVTLGWSFVDSDMVVTQQCGKSIKAIIDTEGWEAFRRMERSALKQICANDRQVVASGGGVVLNPANIQAMKTNGLIVWLGATAETVQERMRQDNNTEDFRPALTDKGSEAEIEDMLLKRNPLYKSASDFIIHTDDMPVKEITSKIIQKLNDTIGE